MVKDVRLESPSGLRFEQRGLPQRKKIKVVYRGISGKVKGKLQGCVDLGHPMRGQSACWDKSAALRVDESRRIQGADLKA